jgi:hypothetical protein
VGWGLIGLAFSRSTAAWRAHWEANPDPVNRWLRKLDLGKKWRPMNYGTCLVFSWIASFGFLVIGTFTLVTALR